MKQHVKRLGFIWLLTSGVALAQLAPVERATGQGPAPAAAPAPPAAPTEHETGRIPAPPQPPHPPTEYARHGDPLGRWWRNPQFAQKLALTADQQKKMDDIFQQNRIKLIDLTASLDKEEVVLEPLLEAEQVDATKIRSQIDRVAQARAELEKANANMLLGIRLVLTQDQWKNLRANAPRPRPGRVGRENRRDLLRLENLPLPNGQYR